MKVEILSQLQNYGISVTKVHNARGSETYNAILRWIIDVNTAMVDKLNDNDSKATLNLMQSLRVKEFPIQDDKIKMEIIGDYYWKFVNYGVDGVEFKRGYPYSFRYIRPTERHITAIKKWIVDKPVSITNYDDTDAENSIERAAYGYATETKKRGIKARPFVEPILTRQKINELVKDIAQATGKDIMLKYFGALAQVK